MNTNSDKKEEREIKYLRFLDETNYARTFLEIHEKFALMIFDFVETKDPINADEFVLTVGFAYEKIHNSCLYLKTVNPVNAQELIDSFDKPKIWQSLSGLLGTFLIAAPKAKESEETEKKKGSNSWALLRLSRIDIPFELWERVDSDYFLNLRFVFPKLTIAEKLDVIHFLLCAFKYKANFEDAFEKAIADLEDLRNELILIAIRPENFSTELHNRVFKARLEDVEAEKRWTEKNLPEAKSKENEDDEMNNFDFERVKTHISKMFSYESQLEYLVNKRADYLQKRLNLPRFDAHLPEFNELCDAEIIRIKELINICELKGIPRNLAQINNKFETPQNESSISNYTTSENKDSQSLRRKVIFLMLLTFQRLDLPEDIIKERIVEVFHGIIGGSRKNLSDLLAKPTAHKDTIKSIKSLSDDLNFVRDQLGKLGLSDNVTAAINEINFLIEELKDKANEQ